MLNVGWVRRALCAVTHLACSFIHSLFYFLITRKLGNVLSEYNEMTRGIGTEGATGIPRLRFRDDDAALGQGIGRAGNGDA